MDIAQHKNDLLFVPLGGSGEIGMNLNLYQYQGKWLMVDLGAGFADDSLPGIDMVVPNINFITKHSKNLLGLVLTHIHEDHLGAVQYLWDELKCPIYATNFTANFLRAKLTEVSFGREVPIHEVECGGKISLDPFEIELVPITHSTPEMQALVIRTELGNILHTGDWKFDHDPLIGDATDEELLRKYGDEGVLAMIGDSTNVFNPGTSGSEGDLRKSLIDLIAGCRNMVVVTTFASNVARVETVIKAAEACGRKVVLAGRSLKRVAKAAKESGYLLDSEPFLEEKDAAKYPRDKLLILCTGCQGEPLAAANKLANRAHPHLRLEAGDTVIFSSKIIPGNDKRIFKLFNAFVKAGIEVLTEKDHFVHVSGHPAQEELKRMYQLVRPKIAIPVHGELVHMHEHAIMAKKWGAKDSVQVENGDVIRLAPGSAGKVGRVHSGYLAIDGGSLIEANSPILQMRRKMQRDGIIVVVLIINFNEGEIKPFITAPGVLDSEADKDIIFELSSELMMHLAGNVEKLIHKNKKASKSQPKHLGQFDIIKTQAKEIIRRVISREVGKKPPIEIMIELI